MSQVTTAPGRSDQAQLDKLCVAIRGKLQFMDYLVRAALADVERFQEETDAGTRIFIRQLIEMHASNLTSESTEMRAIEEFRGLLEQLLQGNSSSHLMGDEE